MIAQKAKLNNIKMMNFLRLICAVLLASFFCSACGKKDVKPAAFEDYFEMSTAGAQFNARVAVSDIEKARGLMHINHLPESDGMFFVYEAPQKQSFWMKSTLIPLEVAFINADGIILEIKNLYPNNLDPVNSASSNVVYCLEMNAGWFAKNNVKTGDKIDLKLLKAAIDARNAK